MKTAIIYYSKHHGNTKKLLDAIGAIVKEKNCKDIGHYSCLGFDTYGPFKLIGGIAKGHPTDQEIQGAIDFYKSLG